MAEQGSVINIPVGGTHAQQLPTIFPQNHSTTYKVVVCSNNQALALLAAMSEAMAVNARATLLEQHVHSKRRPGQNKCNEPDAHNKGSAALASMMGHWYFILALQFCPCGVVHTHLYFST
jgi:hypothetical protein